MPRTPIDSSLLHRTLTRFLDQTAAVTGRWDYRLVGTAAAMLRGADLPVGDIDILLRERAGVDAFGACLTSFRCLAAPAWLPESRQYYANYEIDGVELQLSTVECPVATDTHECVGTGPWQHFSLLPFSSYQVPTVAAELRLLSELRRNRPDRYRPLIALLRTRGCDLALVRRGMDAAGLAPELQRQVLDGLHADSPATSVASTSPLAPSPHRATPPAGARS